jgi:Fe-S-cluster containining protein
MGEIIEIKEQSAPRKFMIRYTTTGEEREVTIDAGKVAFFSAQDTGIPSRMACPFLREKSPGTRVCTVHDTRPELCRQYSCFRVLVCDESGNRLGRVWDASRYFTTTDSTLREAWDREIAGHEITDEMEWEDFVGQLLTGKGYRVVK